MGIINRTFLISIGTVCILVLFQLTGYLSPGSLNWGFHFLGFLPFPYLAAYLILVVFLIVYVLRLNEKRQFSSLAMTMERSPIRFLGIALLGFIGVAYLFKIEAPLWGDGFYIVKNFAQAFNGTSLLYVRNEPLATYYYYGITKLFHSSTYFTFLQAYWYADVLTGIAFLIAAFFLAWNIVEDSRGKLLTFLFLCSGAYMQLFFGYVETYSIVVFWVTLYALLAILFLKGKLVFPWLALCAVLMGVTHYLTMMLAPSLVYLALIEWNKRGLKRIVTGTAIIGAGIVITLWLAGFNIDNLSSWEPHKHYLSLTKGTETLEAQSQAYTLFSVFHLVDILNLYMMLAPAAAVFIFFAFVQHSGVLLKSRIIRFLIIAILPVLAFTCVVKYDLGAAKDWDVNAPFFSLLFVLSCALFFHRISTNTIRAAVLLIGITALNSLTWFSLNTSTEPGIKRTMALLDTRNVSLLGHYATSIHLSTYYHQMNTNAPAVDLWKQYTVKFPGDRRGYLNTLQNIKLVNPNDYVHMSEVYSAWMKIDTADSGIREDYFKLCLDAGNFYFGNDEYDNAKKYYRRATGLDSLSARALNNLGSVYAMQESSGYAISYFRRAVELDSSYSDACYNLGNILYDTGDTLTGRKYLEKASQLGDYSSNDAVEKKSQSSMSPKK